MHSHLASQSSSQSHCRNFRQYSQPGVPQRACITSNTANFSPLLLHHRNVLLMFIRPASYERESEGKCRHLQDRLKLNFSKFIRSVQLNLVQSLSCLEETRVYDMKIIILDYERISILVRSFRTILIA